MVHCLLHCYPRLTDWFRFAAKGTRVPNNEDYGTFEAPLNQENDDPVSDFLYTSNFALLGLHEAAAALDDPKIKAVEDKLADFIIRIQARSTEHPDLDGAFFRAFDCKSCSDLPAYRARSKGREASFSALARHRSSSNLLCVASHRISDATDPCGQLLPGSVLTWRLSFTRFSSV